MPASGRAGRPIFAGAAAACGALALAVAAWMGSSGRGAAQEDAHARAELANVKRVRASGSPGAYVFHVTVASPDEGCKKYASWWEVLHPDGTLVYRRILRHSHKNEQPFTRSGGPVHVKAHERVIVRAHMHPGGYGGRAVAGTVAGGFEATRLPRGFAARIEHAEPQPKGCLF